MRFAIGGKLYESQLLARSKPFALRVIRLGATLPRDVVGQMEIIIEAKLMTRSRVAALLDEAQQLTRITSASKITSHRGESSNRKTQIANRK